MLTLGFVGCGNVGFNALKAFQSKGFPVMGFDISESSRSRILLELGADYLAPTFGDLRRCDVIFECVPTDPLPETGECDLTIVSEVVSELAELETTPDYRCSLFVQRSTCPPGTASRLSKFLTKTDYAVNPSFISKANPWLETVNPERIAYGGSARALSVLEELYHSFRAKSYYTSSSFEAVELLKYIENTLDAVLISLWNEYLMLSDALQLPRDEFIGLMKAVPLRDRFATVLRVPGKAFGLWCLPKDVAAIAALSLTLKCEPSVIAGALKTNEEVKSLYGTNEAPTNALLEFRDGRMLPSSLAIDLVRGKNIRATAKDTESENRKT